MNGEKDDIVSYFDERNQNKQGLHFSSARKIVKMGEIRLCKVGMNIGNELSKEGPFVRPFIVLSTGLGGDLVFGCYLTTKYKQEFDYQYHILTSWNVYGLKQPSYIVLNQPKTISSKRLTRKLNNITIENIRVDLVPLDIIDVIKQKIIEKIIKK